MNREDREKVRQFFSEAWNISEPLETFLDRAKLTQQDLSRLWRSRTFQRLCRRMCGGMATRRELEVGRAAMQAAEKLSTFIAGRSESGEFTELARKAYGDCIKLARATENRDADDRRDAERHPQEPADAGVSRNLTKPERIAILRRMLITAESADR